MISCCSLEWQGKVDGLAIDTSGLTDNWDDAEGRYCTCLIKFQLSEVAQECFVLHDYLCIFHLKVISIKYRSVPVTKRVLHG